MTVVIPCHKGDQHLAERLLKWIAEMGKVDARALLFCAKDCNHPYLLSLAQCAFTNAIWEEDRENIKCEWAKKIPGNLDASGPNSLFRQVSMFFYLPTPKGPWLWLEPDSVPCRPDWYQLLKAEYAQAVARGKPIMGFRVNSQTHPGSTPIPEHSSGMAIYPANLPELCPSVWTCRQTAFDIAAAKEILPQAHWTTLLLDHYCAPSINSMEEADVRAPASLAVYAANKCGSLIPWLRQRHGMATTESPKSAPVTSQSHSRAVDTAFIKSLPRPSAPGGPVVDIYIKTCEKDRDWLHWCLGSITKFAKGFRFIISESEHSMLVGRGWDYKDIDWRHITNPDKEPGYLDQQAKKLSADQHTDADFILFMDSDCVFTKPVTPDDFIRDGKPIWLKTPFGNARDDQQVWKPIMAKFLGREPQHEFMRRHPFIMPRWAFTELRNFCRYRHGLELSDYIMAQAVPGQMLTFSEWNCAGFFLHEFHHDKVAWIDTTTDEVPEAVVWQGFTHAGEARKQEDIAKFREILGAEEPKPIWMTPAVEGIIQRHFESRTVAFAIQTLLFHAHKDGFAKGRILKQLKAAGLAKGAKLAPNPQDESAPVEMPKQTGILLAIHSFPGANDCVARHWPYYYLSGATRIVGIGTTDGKCKWPVDCESVNIGKNRYIDGPHLPQRLADTIEWCLTQPEERFIIAEYDVLFFGGVPQWEGAMLHRTGGKLPDAKASQFMHNPWCLDRETGAKLMHELRAVIQEGHCQSRWPEASPDVALGFAVDRLRLPYREMEHMFTRNSLEEAGALDLAVEAVRNGAIVVHGCKTPHAFDALVGAHKAKKRKRAA